MFACCVPRKHSAPPTQRPSREPEGGGVSHGVQGRWLKGETPLKGGGSRGSNICMQDWARAHVQSGVVVVCCCSCSGLRSRPLYQNQTTRPPPPVENPSQKYPLKIHYFWCFLPWCSSCVLRLADLACPFGHFRVHVDKPSDPHHTASFNTRRHCPVLNPWPPFLGQCVCYAFVWHSIRKWRFLVNVCQSQSPSPWVSVWARERATATAGAVGECHAHVFSCFCSSDSISTPFRLTCPRPCHNKRQASNNKSNEQTNKEPRLKSQWKRIYDALESLSENK